jgi:hypothetical protein
MKWTVHQYFHQSILNAACLLMFSLCDTPLFSQELQWKVLGHLKQTRRDLGIATIGNGKILVIGGFKEQRGYQKERLRGITTAECEIIDVESRSITAASRMNFPRAQSVVLQTADSNVVVLSGLNSDSTTTPMCEMFDRKKNVWRVLGSLLIGRHNHMAAFINQEEIIVVGGRAIYNYAGAIAEAEIFNIRTGKSRMISDFPIKEGGGLGYISDIVSPHRPLFFSGRSEGVNSYRTSNVYSYDTLSRRWVCVTSVPDGVCWAAGKRLFDGRLIFAGGAKRETRAQSTHSPFIRIEENVGFVITGNMIQPRSSSQLEQWDKELIVTMGGVGSSGSPLSHTEWFDLRTKQSFEGAPMNEPRASFASASFPIFDRQGKQQKACIVVIGGVNIENRSLTSVEILETTNPQLIELPSAEIASRRLQHLLTSPTVIVTLTVFILVLIFALLYLLYQVFIIRRKSKFSLVNGALEEQKL